MVPPHCFDLQSLYVIPKQSFFSKLFNSNLTYSNIKMKSLFKKKEDPTKPPSNTADAPKSEASTAAPRTGNLFGFKSLGLKSKSDSQEGLKQQPKSGYFFSKSFTF
jgi:hypothetical protein